MKPSTPPRQTNKLWTPPFVVALMMALTLFLGVMFLTSGVARSYHRNHGRRFMAGMMTTVFMIAAIITRPIFGYVIQRVRLKPLNNIVMIALGLLIYALSLTDNMAVLLLLRALQGVGFGILSTTINTMATSVLPSSRMGEGVGYYGMASSGGTSFAPMIALAILQSVSYRALILTSTALIAVTLVLNLIAPSAPEQAEVVADPAPTTSSETQQLSFLDYAFDVRALVPCLIVFFFSFTLGGVTSFLNSLAGEAGIAGSASLFFLVQATVLLISKALAGNIYDRFGHKVIMYPAAIAGMLGLYLLTIVNSTPVLLLAAFFYGLAYGFLTTTLQAIAIGELSKTKQGIANAMYLSFMDLGMALGSSILGLVAGALGYRAIYGVSLISLVVLLLVYTLAYGRKSQAPQAKEA